MNSASHEGQRSLNNIHIRVPATSANLGPGYDCAGLALALYDELSVELLPEPGVLQIVVSGEGEQSVPTDASHLVVRSISRGLAEFGVTLPSMRLTCVNRIPHGRGLGSSSAAIVGGLALARELLAVGVEQGSRVSGPTLSDVRLLEIATELEGHPDNVAPALLGGLTLAWLEPPGPDPESSHHAGRAIRLQPSRLLEPVVAIARAPLATDEARDLIPASVTHGDAVTNSSRAALLATAFTSAPELLFTATQDRLHQHYRSHAYPASYELVAALRERDVPAMISGAGPTVIAIGVAGSKDSGDRVARLVRELLGGSVGAVPQGTDFDVVRLDIDEGGVTTLG